MARTPDASALVVTLPGGARLGVPVRLVRRVEEPESLRGVPLAPPGILGIAEVRGRIVTLIDAARLAGTPRVAEEVASVILLEPPYVHLAIALPRGTSLEPPAALPGSAGVPIVSEAALDALLARDGVASPAGAVS